MHSPEHLSHLEISAFIDGELSASDAHDLEQHVAECHRCALSVVSAMQLKAATVRASENFAAPPEALSRLAAQLRGETAKKPARVYPFRSWAWGAVAAGLVLALSLLAWRSMHPPSNLSAELLDQHLAVLSTDSSPEVISSDRHTVKPWFQGKLPFTFNLPELQDSEFKLLGGKLIYFNHSPGAQLLFELRKHQLSVFIVQAQSDGLPLGSGVRQASEKGFSEETWSESGLRYFIISDTNSADVHALGELLRVAARQ